MQNCKIISIATEKGGVGKTTTAQALIEGLRAKRYKVLGVDLDTQGNLTFSLNQDKAPFSVYELITKQKKAEEVIQNDFIKASDYISLLDKESPTSLKEALEPIKNNYDFIIIDTPPKLDKTLIKALTSSNFVILPTFAEAFSLKGIDKAFKVVRTIQQQANGNKNLKIAGILLTMFNERNNLSKQLKELIEAKAKSYNTKVFKTTINRNIAIAEAQALQEPLLTYNGNIKAIKDYKAFVKEFLETIKE